MHRGFLSAGQRRKPAFASPGQELETHLLVGPTLRGGFMKSKLLLLGFLSVWITSSDVMQRPVNTFYFLPHVPVATPHIKAFIFSAEAQILSGASEARFGHSVISAEE